MKTTDVLARIQPTLTEDTYAELVRQIGDREYLTEKEFERILASVVFSDTDNPHVRDVEFISDILDFRVDKKDPVYA